MAIASRTSRIDVAIILCVKSRKLRKRWLVLSQKYAENVRFYERRAHCNTPIAYSPDCGPIWPLKHHIDLVIVLLVLLASGCNPKQSRRGHTVLTHDVVSLRMCSLCCELAEAMRNKDQQENTTHNEEMKGRINKDETDRSILRTKLETSIEIFDPFRHSKGLVNIVSGKVITDPGVNVYERFRIKSSAN